MSGSGRVVVAAAPDAVWAALLDPMVLQRIIPGAERVERIGAARFRAVLVFGVGWLGSRCEAGLELSELERPCRLTLVGDGAGLFGGGSAAGHVTLAAGAPGSTVLSWRYTGTVHGPVALAGSRLLRIASGRFVDGFFAGLVRWARHASVASTT